MTDLPPNMLDSQQAVTAQDYHVNNGVPTMRRGWEYDGSTAVFSPTTFGTATSVWRSKFTSAGTTVTLVSNGIGIWTHASGAAGTEITRSYVDVFPTGLIPRCVYKDQVYFCSQTGAPTVRYSGSSVLATGTAGGAATWTANRSTLSIGTAGGFGFTASPGSYVETYIGTEASKTLTTIRVSSSNTIYDITVEGVVSGATIPAAGGHYLDAWYTIPCISIYDNGTISSDGTTITGYGTKWNDALPNGGPTNNSYQFSFLANNSGSYVLIPAYRNVFSTDTDSVVSSASTPYATPMSYKAIVPMKFKDVTAHRESLCGTGIDEYPSRVYIGPPGWDPAFPPGAVLPFDPTDSLPTSSENYFLMDFVDVPSSLDSDPCVALLSSPGPLLVLKRNSTYGIYGSFPSFSQALISPVGCIDIRSAFSSDEGQFWCGEQGIYRYSNGRVIDLTLGRINDEWRNIVREGVTYCTAGIARGHLLVSVKTASTSKTYAHDLARGIWTEVSNIVARFMHTARLSGEIEALFALSDSHPNRVIDLSPMFSGTKVTDRTSQTKAMADSSDDAGSGPTMKIHTGNALLGGIDTERRAIDLELVANVYDTTSPSTSLQIQYVTSGGRLSGGAGEQTKTLTAVSGDATDLVDLHQRTVNRSGRTHQVKLETTTVDSDSSKVQISRLGIDYRDARGRA